MILLLDSWFALHDATGLRQPHRAALYHRQLPRRPWAAGRAAQVASSALRDCDHGRLAASGLTAADCATGERSGRRAVVDSSNSGALSKLQPTAPTLDNGLSKRNRLDFAYRGVTGQSFDGTIRKSGTGVGRVQLAGPGGGFQPARLARAFMTSTPQKDQAGSTFGGSQLRRPRTLPRSERGPLLGATPRSNRVKRHSAKPWKSNGGLHVCRKHLSVQWV